MPVRNKSACQNPPPPHDPAFDVRAALYSATGMDLTQTECIFRLRIAE